VILAKAPTTAWRIIEGEAVILSLESKVLRGLNPVGSRVWELIDGRRNVEEIIGVIVAEFDASPEAAALDVKGFVQDLLAKGLVIPAS
jgi:hypothetical protein